MKTVKRIFALLLVLALCMSMAPFSVSAEEPAPARSTTELLCPDGTELVPAHDDEELIMTCAEEEKGKLRILYNVFSSDVGNLPTIGTIHTLPAKAVLVNGKYNAAYCLQIALAANEGTNYTWSDLEFREKALIGDIMALGFHWSSDGYWSADSDSNYKWAVTQLMVWAVMNGTITRDSKGNAVVPDALDADMGRAATLCSDSAGMTAYYRELKTTLIKLRQVPSFASKNQNDVPVISLSWNGEKYSKTVTDKNEVLSRYSFSIEGMNVTSSGNQLTIESDEPVISPVLSAPAVFEAPGGKGAAVIWRTNNGAGGTGEQDFVSYCSDADPVPAYICVGAETVGSAELVKISEDGIVSGISFQITGSDGSTCTKTTDSSGCIFLDGLPIYEEEPVLDENGEPVIDEETGEPQVVKGDTITYTATEVSVPIRYVIPSSQTFQLTEAGETSISFENRLKKWRVAVTKADRETGTVAQGDATLGGAVYGIYHNGILQDTYTTDSSGRFTSRYYICGTGWTLKEITPSEGYLLNEETVPVGLSPYDTTIEYNNTSKGVKEQIIKGKIAITKHTDDGSTQIETPETGAEFQIYLSSSGSYASAKTTERDTITIGDNGYAETKLLPYGMYTVHQTKGWEGKEKITDFQVFISEDGKTYSLIINNRVFEALIQIVKKDAETGRTIPCSGVGFKVKDLTSGKWVSQHINYPTPMDISIFYTDVTGRLMLPAPLTYGSYQLVEQQSAYGYVLNGEPVPFTVDGTAKTITVELGNTPQKGQVTIHKTGEIFQSVKNVSGRYVPVYEETGLAGAVYAMYAEEDVKTGDGTLRYSAGELIEKVQTGTDGMATFPKVYLGKYRVVEETAPYGFVLDPTVYHVEFTYAGQTVTLQTEALECYDQRQKVDISLVKALEQDETYGVGMNDEYTNIRFGLYAAEGFTAADGKRIPKDGLLETISLNAALKGSFTANLPLGSYYVQETATDAHYILNDRKFPVKFEYAGQKKSTARLEVDDGTPIENDLKRGRIMCIKTDEMGNPLAGAVFGLFAQDNAEPLVTAVSGDDGEFGFEDVPVGAWFIKEIHAPAGYVFGYTSNEVTISEDGECLEFQFSNRLIPYIPTPKPVLGDISGLKVDNAGAPLEGVTFGLFLAGWNSFVSDDAIKTAQTDKNGRYIFSEVPCGKYIVAELETLPGFILAAKPVEAEVTEKSAHVVLKHIINDCTKVLISKADMTTGKELPGAKLQLFDRDEKLIEEWTSGDNPHLIEKLIPGEYRLHEEKAPSGYTKAEDVKFTVEPTGEIQKVIMKDAPIPTVPNTGEGNTLILVSCLFFFSLAGAWLICIALRRIRRKENNR